MEFFMYLLLLLIAIFTGFTDYNLHKIRILLEEMKDKMEDKMEDNSEAKEDLPSIQEPTKLDTKAIKWQRGWAYYSN